MAIFALPNIIGPEVLLEWTFEDKEAYRLAREEERRFVIALQEKLSAQLACPIMFDNRLVGIKTDYELEEFSEMKLPIGNTDGIIWLKDSIRRWYEDENASIKNSQQVSISSFSHLMDRSPISGILLPLDFPRVFNYELRGDSISIGSSIKVQKELNLWLNQILPWYERKESALAKIYKSYCKNFIEVLDFSIKKGVAVEIL